MIFDKFRQFRINADEPDYDCREGCFMRLYRNVDEKQFSEWIDLLIADGFEKMQYTNLNGNLYACLQGDVTVNAFYTPCDGMLRVAANENKPLPCFEKQSCDRETDTVFYAFENDQALIDCGMCLLVQCPDYSFFVVDSGHYMQFNDNDRIYKFMRDRTPEGQKVVVNGWLLTHAHSDHISKFMDFLRYNRNDVIIEGIYSNLIPDTNENSRFWSTEEVLLSRKLFKMLDGYEQKISEPPQEEDNADNSPIADASDVEIVDEREMELALALQEFLINALGYAADGVDCDDIGIDYDELMSILDKFEEVLYESGYYMYRPKIVEDAEGNKRLVEFPFDDELPFEEE